MEIVEIISTVGFPIAAFIMMFWLNVKIIGKNTEAITRLTEKLK